MIENLSNKLFFYHSKLNISRTVVDKTHNIPHIVSLAFKTMDRLLCPKHKFHFVINALFRLKLLLILIP